MRSPAVVRTFIAALTVFLNLVPSGAVAAQGSKPSVLEEVGIDQHLGDSINLSLEFRDETGKTVPLSRYFHGKPVVLAPIYLTCSSLCPMTLNSLMQALHVIQFNAGKDFEVVAFSFDPKESPVMAAAAKARYVREYNRQGTTAGFHFLTG